MFENLNAAVIISRVIALLVAFTLHELAHAVTADHLGDPTPRRMGRITLNPLAHLDPIGTLALIVAGFGWAKPVLVNPMNMRGNPRTAMAIVAIAGPLTNLLLATLFALPIRFGLVPLQFESGNNLFPDLPYLLFVMVWINLILMFFNLIPIPPLDGSKVLFAILPPDMADRLYWLEQYGFLLLLAVVFIFSQVLIILVVEPSVVVLRFLVGPGF